MPRHLPHERLDRPPRPPAYDEPSHAELMDRMDEILARVDRIESALKR